MAVTSKIPSIKFSNGYQMPVIGLGTYLSKGGEVGEAVKYAIQVGYRHIDTAFFYENEKEVGLAIKEKINDGTVKREDLFITTKLWNNCHAKDRVVPMCKKSLENLGLDYVDLYLIHWPFGFKEGDDLTPKDSDGNVIYSDVDYIETWQGMEDCVSQGLARSIGISNFNSEQITRILSIAKIKPVNNQIECNINLHQTELINFCKKHDITVTGFSPLGRPGNTRNINNSWDKPEFIAIQKKYNKSPAQIAARFVYQLGAIPIPKSVTPARIKENAEIFDFSLTDEEMNTIKSIGTGERTAPFAQAAGHKYYPFNIPY